MKKQSIATLTELRRIWRMLTEPMVRHGFKHAALVTINHIEQTMPDWEKWTTLPEESELTEQSRLGDHIAVTRKLLGFIP